MNFESYGSWDELDVTDARLLQAALDSASKAYAPYSRFRVGAAILLEDGSVVCGNNQENASYPQGMCAERVALFSASAQFPEKRIIALALVAESSEMPLSPCGEAGQPHTAADGRRKRQSNSAAEVRRAASLLFFQRKPECSQQTGTIIRRIIR